MTNVSLDSKSCTLMVGSTVSLAAVVFPSDASYPEVTWSSNDITVATVGQNGVIKAVNPGDTVINATADGISDTCSVHVTEICFIVSFEPNGGNPVNDQTAKQNTIITKPADPQKTGYTFIGWYREIACTSAWIFATDHVTSNITLFAKWTANTYTVTFNSKGASAVGSKTVEYGSTITEPATPIYSGNAFGGWYTDIACTNAWNFATARVMENITLYVKWNNIQQIDVSTSDSRHGTVSGGDSFANGVQATVTATPKNGYCFTKWVEGSTTVSTSAAYTFTVSGRRALKACFSAVRTPSISVSTQGYSSAIISWKAVPNSKGYENL